LFYGPHDVRLEDVAMPTPGLGEVRVRIAAALTCGTDQKTYDRGHPVIIKSIPSAFGHEMAGTVEAVGPDVTTVQVGDRVVVANSAPCMACLYCRRERFNLCENLTFLNGAFAQHILVPAQVVRHNLHVIPETLPFACAALAEPLACVLHAAERVRITAGDNVAILGTGPMAFLFIQVVAAMSGRAIVIGRNAERLKLAAAFGVPVVDTTRGDVAAAVKGLTDGHGADVVIEAIGQPETWQQATLLAARGGRICLYGGCVKGTEISFDTYRLHYEELSIHGVFHHTPALFKRAVNWLTEGRIQTGLFVAERRKLHDLPSIFEGDDPVKPLKFVIEP
jgi:L-iditol 2-dehydrogenase